MILRLTGPMGRVSKEFDVNSARMAVGMLFLYIGDMGLGFLRAECLDENKKVIWRLDTNP